MTDQSKHPEPKTSTESPPSDAEAYAVPPALDDKDEIDGDEAFTDGEPFGEEPEDYEDTQDGDEDADVDKAEQETKGKDMSSSSGSSAGQPSNNRRTSDSHQVDEVHDGTHDAEQAAAEDAAIETAAEAKKKRLTLIGGSAVGAILLLGGGLWTANSFGLFGDDPAPVVQNTRVNQIEAAQAANSSNRNARGGVNPAAALGSANKPASNNTTVPQNTKPNLAELAGSQAPAQQNSQLAQSAINQNPQPNPTSQSVGNTSSSQTRFSRGGNLGAAERSQTGQSVNYQTSSGPALAVDSAVYQDALNTIKAQSNEISALRSDLNSLNGTLADVTADINAVARLVEEQGTSLAAMNRQSIAVRGSTTKADAALAEISSLKAELNRIKAGQIGIQANAAQDYSPSVAEQTADYRIQMVVRGKAYVVHKKDAARTHAFRVGEADTPFGTINDIKQDPSLRWVVYTETGNIEEGGWPSKGRQLQP